MRRAGITDTNNVTLIQYNIFKQEILDIPYNVYLACPCFENKTLVEIQSIVRKEISERAVYSGDEFIAESMVQYLGAEKHSELSENVYNYLIKEWNK